MRLKYGLANYRGPLRVFEGAALMLAAALGLCGCASPYAAPVATSNLEALLVQHDPAQAPDQQQFQAALASYRAAEAKPVIGEDVRRFQVQAEAAVREKRFPDAATAYAKGLAIAPWWPEGRYNLALVLGETGKPTQAILEMQDYLALVPNGPNARSGQDKIYEWEAKIPANGRCKQAVGIWTDGNGFPLILAADGTSITLDESLAANMDVWTCLDPDAGKMHANVKYPGDDSGTAETFTISADGSKLTGVFDSGDDTGDWTRGAGTPQHRLGSGAP